MAMTNSTLTPDPVLRRSADRALVTVTVPAPSESTDAGDRFDVELSNARRHVVELLDGTPDVDAESAADRLVDALRAHGHADAMTLVGVAGPDDVAVFATAEALPAGAAAGPLTALGELIAAQQTWIPHALVMVDRIGADVELVTAGHEEIDLTVDGESQHITKSNPGGWSQRRFQQRAEEQWEENLRLVADRLTQETRDRHLQLIALTGDETAVAMLRDLLPDDLQDLVVDLETGGRADDGSADHVQEEADAAVRRAAAYHRASRQRAVTDAVGRGDGVTGRHDVLRALFEGRVETLVVHLRAAADAHAYIGDEPSQIVADSARLHELDLPATRVPLADGALAAAASTGAEVVVVQEALTDYPDGLAASLRGREALG